jgi:ADP-heptose:LPS heptosyltransferase
MFRLLAINPGGVEDQILFFSTLQGIRDAFPTASIDILVEPSAAVAYQVCPVPTKTIPFSFSSNPSLADWVNLIGQLRERDYEVVLSTGTTNGNRFLLWLTGIPHRIGYAGNLTEKLLTNPITLRPYVASMYHDLVKGLGIKQEPSTPKVIVSEKAQAWVAQEFKTREIEDGKLVLIYPGAGKLSANNEVERLYPTEQWGQVLENLLDKTKNQKLQFAVIQGPEDKQWAAQLQQKLGKKPANPVMFITPPDLSTLTALIQSAKLLLCVDSIPMHLAVATNTPLIGLFGPGNLVRVLPKSLRFIPLQDQTSMAAIKPQRIVHVALEQLGSKKAPVS